ncbi:MAG TPA: pseudouridine synthase [Edaphocola sp.]|nr:pseudouridine synthase [Edaphocola sp.]
MSKFQYILFNKPFQTLSQFSPSENKKTLADYLKGIEKDIYPVGRLDYDSEGLLLLTNDSSLNKKLLHPKSGYKKTYWVQIEGAIKEEDIKPLRNGVHISVNGKIHKTLPAQVSIIPNPEEQLWERNPPIRYRKEVPTSWLSITIGEGKNRQVRKMTAAIGFPTLRLIRVQIGNLNLKQLLPEPFIYLDEKDIEAMLSKS